ncbi:exodeoxyribonuclease VII large subunit [Candidatus Uhrbacteria bacterium]|nr:exodeoxyribonuclease VII large subunit [Candidatus Uhrbacteria bacterium]
MQIMTVSGFLAYVNETFKAIWDTTEVAIEGEVSGYRLSQGQWASFDLKDAEALVNVFLPVWKLNVPIQDGLRVRVFGCPRVYPKYGKFSFSAERIEIAGEGGLRKALALLHQKLEQEGLFDSARKRPLPRFPERIALIASRESAAYGDFIRILHERWGGLSIDLYHVLVQGEGAPVQIVRAIHEAGRGEYDALVLTRGGGSLEELMSFNDERVVRALFSSKIPTLVGIGHERDITMAEEVADVRGSTPTDCARRLVPDRTELLYALSHLQEGVSETFLAKMVEWTEQCDDVVLKASRWVATLSERITSMIRLFQSFDPRAVVKRGYAIVRDRSGKVRTSIKGMTTKDKLALEMRDGTIAVSVE